METSVPETKDTETSVASSLARVDLGTKYQSIISNDHVAHWFDRQSAVKFQTYALKPNKNIFYRGSSKSTIPWIGRSKRYEEVQEDVMSILFLGRVRMNLRLVQIQPHFN